MPSLMEKKITQACVGTEPKTRARMKALSSVRWVLATDDGRFVKVDDQLKASLTSKANEAAIYDGRDNEQLKSRFMGALLGVPLCVVLLE